MRISLAIVTFLTFAFFTITANAQIGYQVSLIDSATGEPRANETVSCTVTLSGQESTIFTGTQNVTSNEFGVLSLTVGNADMFNNVDWASELPLFVEVSVDGKSIGKSQVLSVPIAEYAKNTGELTYENIGNAEIVCYNGDWSHNVYKFSKDKSFMVTETYTDYPQYNNTWTGNYIINGNTVCGSWHEINDGERTCVFVGHYFPNEGNGVLFIIEGHF